jgi:hypothetical protein
MSTLRPDEWLVLTSGLHVPSQAFVRQQIGAPGMAVYVLAEELTGRRTRLAEIVTTLRKIGAYEALQALSRIGLLLENHEWSNRDLQIALVRNLLPRRCSQRAEEILTTQAYRFVFFEQQILSAMQLAILYCPKSSTSRLEGNRPLFEEFMVTCVLGVTDVLESTYMRSAKHQPVLRGGQFSEALASALLRNAFFNYRDEFIYMLGRFWDLFLELPSQLSDSPNYVDVENAFVEATGATLREFFAVGFALAGHFMQASGLAGEQDVRKFVIDPNVYFSTTSLADTTVSCTRELHFSFVTMRQSPLLRFQNGACIPLSLRFLHERSTIGVYWLIHDNLPAQSRSTFRTFFGELFEEYVKRTFARVFPSAPHLAKRVVLARQYGAAAQRKEASDVIVLYAHAALFVEVKAARLRMEDSGIKGDVGAFRQDLQSKVIGAARQIDSVVRDFLSGQLCLEGLPASDMRRAYSIVLTFGHVPQTPPVWREIQNALDNNGLLQGPLFAPLQLINIEELELLAWYLASGGPRSLMGILDGRADDAYYRFFPLKMYLAHKLPAPAEENQWVDQHLKQLQNVTIEALGLDSGQTSAQEDL